MGAGTTLAEAYVRLRIDQKQAEKDITTGLGNAGEAAGKKASGGFSKALKAGLAGLAGLGALDFFKGAIDEGLEAQKVGAQTTAVLKSTGGAAGITAGQIGDLATAISLKTGVDDEAIQSGENLLLTFTNIRNEAGKGNDIFNQTTSIMQDMSAALGQDTKTSAIQLGKALNDPVKGVSALQKVGVSFTADQKKQIKTLVDSGKTMDAQKVILGELKKEFGGSAEAIATPGDKMKVAWGNLQETIGTKLLPVLSTLSNILTGIINFVSDHSTVLGLLATIILTVVAAVKLWNIVQAILDAELIANPIGLVVVAIAALVAAIIYVATKTQFFQTVWHSVWGFLKQVGAWFAGPFVNFFVNGWKWVTDKGGKALDWFKSLPGKIKTAVSKIGDIIVAPYRWAFNKISDFWNGTVGQLSFRVPDWVPGIGGDGFSMPKLPHLATGGDITRTGLAVVGENGPETVMLPAGARVLPHGTAPMGAPTVHVYLGTREIEDIIDVQIDEAGREARRLYTSGAGARAATVRRTR